jgi:hypothetical protein
VAAEGAERAAAQGPQIVGRSFAEIETELQIAVHLRQQTDRRSCEQSTARLLAGQQLADQRAAAQAEATALLALWLAG